MRRTVHLFAALLLLLPLLACAPTVGRQGAPSAGSGGDLHTFHAAFSRQGVAWVSGGRACVARAPAYTPACPRLGAGASDVAWHDGDAWAALPGLGLAVTLDRGARSVNVGAVLLLTSALIYREDGTALTYAGTPGGQVTGAPSQAVTGGDGQDYVLLAGQLRRVTDQALVEAAPGPLLVATPLGAASVLVPTVYTRFGSYRLNAGQLERLDVSGQVLQRVPHEAAQLGLVGEDLVTVTPAGVIRRFSQELQALPLR